MEDIYLFVKPSFFIATNFMKIVFSKERSTLRFNYLTLFLIFFL